MCEEGVGAGGQADPISFSYNSRFELEEGREASVKLPMTGRVNYGSETLRPEAAPEGYCRGSPSALDHIRVQGRVRPWSRSEGKNRVAS